MQLLFDAGLNAYRFGAEWTRIEPSPRHLLQRRTGPLPTHGTLMTTMSRAAEQQTDKKWLSPTVDDDARPVLPAPDPEVGYRLVEAHHAVRGLLRERTGAALDWTVANQRR